MNGSWAEAAGHDRLQIGARLCGKPSTTQAA